MRTHAAERPIATGAGPIPVTVSIGLATEQGVVPELFRGEELVRAADKALYCAKHNGRNRVECAPDARSAGQARSLASR